MRILLATPWFSGHLDAGLFWASALGRLGHDVVLWDHRAEPDPPRIPCQVALVMKGDETVAARLRPWTPNVVSYWPDWFDREPGLLDRLLKAYDLVATPVRPTPAGCLWLPTGWDPQFHQRRPGASPFPSLAWGTYTERKHHYLVTIRPSFIMGNGWSPAVSPSPVLPPHYGPALVAILSAAAVQINIHRDNVGLNRRIFEMCACGPCISDRVPGVEEVFGKSLTQRMSFETPAEGRAMLIYYLEHPLEREELWASERELIKPFTYTAAAERLLSAIHV